MSYLNVDRRYTATQLDALAPDELYLAYLMLDKDLADTAEERGLEPDSTLVVTLSLSRRYR